MGKTYGKHPAQFCHKSSFVVVEETTIEFANIVFFSNFFKMQKQF